MKLTGAERKPQFWRIDYLKALCWFCGALTLLGGCLTFYYYDHGDVLLIAAMSSVYPFYQTLSALDKAFARKYGLRVEREARANFLNIMPPSWRLEEFKVLETIGDIDMPLRLPNAELCLVEIKSWKHFYGMRKIKVRWQIYRQMRAVKAHYGIAWLPVSRRKLCTRYRNIFLIEGSPSYLRACLQNIIRYDVMIKFPQKPSSDILSYIKSKRFRWNKEHKIWAGKCNEIDMQEMRSQIKEEGGYINYSAIIE